MSAISPIIANFPLRTAPALHEPGLYAQMPEEEYHQDPSLGSTDVKRLLVSPECYWFNSSWNPDYVPDIDTVARIWGKAYHKILFEGEEAYETAYAVRPSREDYPDAIETVKELQLICEDYKVTKGGKKAEIVARLRDKGWDGEVYDEIYQNWIDGNPNKTPIPADLDVAARRARRLIENNPAIENAIKEGFGEVSIFLRDPATGVPIKARVDWLTAQWFVDGKTFSNSRDLNVDKAIVQACAYNGYYIQLVQYHALIQLAKKLPDKAFHGFPPEFVQAFKATPEHQSLFIFIGTDTPCVRARGMRRKIGRGEAALWQAGYGAFRRAIDIYGECRKTFGDAPWFTIEPIKYFDDLEFPAFIME